MWLAYKTWSNYTNEIDANQFACDMVNHRRNAVFLYVSKSKLIEDSYKEDLRLFIEVLHRYRITVYAYYLEDKTFPSDLNLENYVNNFIAYMDNSNDKQRFDGLLLGVEIWTSSYFNGDWANKNSVLSQEYLPKVSIVRNLIQPKINGNANGWGELFTLGGVVQSVWHKRFLDQLDDNNNSVFPNGSFIFLTEDADNDGISEYYDFVVPEAYFVQCSDCTTPHDPCWEGGKKTKERGLSNSKSNGDLFWILEADYDHAIAGGATVVIGMAIDSIHLKTPCDENEPDKPNERVFGFNKYPDLEYGGTILYSDDVWDMPDVYSGDEPLNGIEHYVNNQLSPYGTSIFPGRNLMELDFDPLKMLDFYHCLDVIKSAEYNFEFPNDNKIIKVVKKHGGIDLQRIISSVKVFNTKGQLMSEHFDISYLNTSMFKGLILIHLSDSEKGINEVHKIYVN